MFAERRTYCKKTVAVLSLDPYLDEEGLLRVGGRLRKHSADNTFKNPLILLGKNHY